MFIEPHKLGFMWMNVSNNVQEVTVVSPVGSGVDISSSVELRGAQSCCLNLL